MFKPKRQNSVSLEQDIFQKGSTTYYWSSKFFPAAVREDVLKLYSFVRVADDYVDCIPAQADKFHALRASWDKAKADIHFDTVRRPRDTVDERVVKNIIDVVRNYGCDPAWIESFLDSMQADLDQKEYKTLDDTLWYIYGSAEVIGLIMCKIMGLPSEATHAACMQGRAMQFVNFIRDIDEDNGLGRCYFPLPDLQKFGLKYLKQDGSPQTDLALSEFIKYQLKRYESWQTEAESGFKYIPKRLRIPLQTAVDTYNWTAHQIAQKPLLVFEKKIKPNKFAVLGRAVKRVATTK